MTKVVAASGFGDGMAACLKPLGEVDELVWLLLDANSMAARDGNVLAAYILVEDVASVVLQLVKMKWRHHGVRQIHFAVNRCRIWHVLNAIKDPRATKDLLRDIDQRFVHVSAFNIVPLDDTGE